MYPIWLREAKLYELLQHLDDDLAAEARRGGCPLCDGVLHRASFPRKPRGPAELPPGYDRRHSFCCAVDGCRKRVMPPSVRFLGRRVFTGAVVVLASALRHGLTPPRGRCLREPPCPCPRATGATPP